MSEAEAKRIRITIPADQSAFIEQQAKERNLEFNQVVYELISEQIKQENQPMRGVVEADAIERIEAQFIEIQARLDRMNQQPVANADSEAEEGNLARLLTLTLQAHLQPPLHRLAAQAETFQAEVRAANQSGVDRWFVVKAELEVLRHLTSQIALAATPPERRSEVVNQVAFLEERFRQFETHLPAVPDYFLSSHTDS